MNPERDILELLILCRENIEEYWKEYNAIDYSFCITGLCGYIYILGKEKIISKDEEYKLLKYIFGKKLSHDTTMDDHCWTKREIQPRIEFLDKLIKEKQDEKSNL